MIVKCSNLLLLVGLVAAARASADEQARDPELVELEKELSEANAETNQLDSELDDLQSELVKPTPDPAEARFFSQLNELKKSEQELWQLEGREKVLSEQIAQEKAISGEFQALEGADRQPTKYDGKSRSELERILSEKEKGVKFMASERDGWKKVFDQNDEKMAGLRRHLGITKTHPTAAPKPRGFSPFFAFGGF